MRPSYRDQPFACDDFDDPEEMQAEPPLAPFWRIAIPLATLVVIAVAVGAVLR